MKTAVLVAFGVLAFALVAAAQKPDAAQSAAAKPTQDTEKIQSLGYSSPSAQAGAAPAAPQKPVQPPSDDALEKSRRLASMILNVERAHRNRVARLERLRQIYEESGAAEQLARVAALRAKEHARYEAAMRGYERDLGPGLFAQLRAAMDRYAGEPPAAPPQGVPPAPAPQGNPDAPDPSSGGERGEGGRR